MVDCVRTASALSDAAAPRPLLFGWSRYWRRAAPLPPPPATAPATCQHAPAATRAGALHQILQGRRARREPARESSMPIPDAVPRLEALHRSANRPYSVLGRDYVPGDVR